MIMVQKPLHLLSSPSTHHRRHPSAPPAVLVQPTHIPGLLSLSKPHSNTPPRSQQQHHGHNHRQSRSSHNKPKPIIASRPSQQPPLAANAQPPLSEDPNKLSTPPRLPTKSRSLTVTPAPTPEKPPRGRQSSKLSKDKSKPRSNSQSAMSRNNNRRNHAQLHQGSPPNPSNLPSQAEVTNKRNSLPHSQSLRTHQHNSFDPFLVSSESESDNPPSTPTKASPPVPSAPKLSPRPTGKLARRRQNVKDVPPTSTPSMAVSVPRRHGQVPPWEGRALTLSRSVPSLSSIPSSEATRDVFPICDDLEDDDVFAPSTPVRSKGGPVTWLQSPIYNDGPRTAPLTNTFASFPFNSKLPPTPTPGRMLQHARSPSEGVFNLSMDEDSSSLSDASAELKIKSDSPPRRRDLTAATTPMGKRDFWASSKFQNSPSPDVLPVPAFKAQAALL